MCIQKTPVSFLSGPVPQALPEHALMLNYKVDFCTKSWRHDWGSCPYAHKGELSSRRSPSQHLPILCRNSVHSTDLKEKCPLGNNCPFAHNHFEYWLHPGRFRTSMCRNAASCKRTICFFAHNESELRKTIYSCSTGEADTPAAASEHVVAGAAAEAAGLAVAERTCPHCVTRHLLAFQQCIDGETLIERLQEVVTPNPSRASSTIGSSEDSSAASCTGGQSASSGSISSSTEGGSSTKASVCSICLGPMNPPPLTTAPTAALGNNAAGAVDTAYCLDQQVCAASGQLDGSWEGLPPYLRQLLGSSSGKPVPAVQAAPSMGGLDGLGDGWADGGLFNVLSGSGWAVPPAGPPMGPSGMPSGFTPDMAGVASLLGGSSTTLEGAWAGFSSQGSPVMPNASSALLGLVEGGGAATAGQLSPSSQQGGLGLPGLDLGSSSAPALSQPAGGLYPQSRTTSSSPTGAAACGGSSPGSGSPGAPLDNMSDLQAVLSMLHSSQPNSMGPGLAQRGLGPCSGPRQQQPQQQLLDSMGAAGQAGLGLAARGGWAQQGPMDAMGLRGTHAPAAAGAPGLGGLLDRGGFLLEQGGAWGMAQQRPQGPAPPEVQVWQWLAAQQAAGAAAVGGEVLLRGYGNGLLAPGAQEAFWGNAAAANLPRVAGLYG